MSMENNLVFELAGVTEKAAFAASSMVGLGDEKKADQVAVDAMRKALNTMKIKGRIVIGEGERDEAPMLYIGEKVGTGDGPEIDIALDPLEGTTITAKAMSNALSVVAIADKGNLLYAPDTYMEKIAVGGNLPEGIVDLDSTVEDNIRNLAKAKNKKETEITACVLDRPRHAKIIESLRKIGARVSLISDGDVAGVIATSDKTTGIDIYLGVGGAPEGVLAASALKCIGGQMECRLVIRNQDEENRAKKIGIVDLKKKYRLRDMVRGDVIFSATGVTDGTMLNGVRKLSDHFETNTLVMFSQNHMVHKITSRYQL